jgi:CRISPR/Cas system-associated exonuclease Cas4 (RecB family)
MDGLGLDEMLLEHVLHRDKGAHGWEDRLLHISDIGSCPRAAAYRLLGTPTREIFGEELRKKKYMYYLANWLHDECFSAWGEAGILVEKECSIRGLLPMWWAGRFDAIIDYDGGERIIDVKTKAYIGKTAQFPQTKHMFQVAAYHMFVAKEYSLKKNPMLFYIQRDLQHIEARECVVDVTDNAREYITSQMKELEAARDNLPELPKILPRKIKYTGKKVHGHHMDVSACTNNDCTSEWCDYSGGPCEPDVGEDLIAWRNGEDWVLTDEGEDLYKDSFLAFLDAEAMDAYEGD